MKTTTIKGIEQPVSKICLGTMTWGQQNNQSDANAQMDYALEHGVNFWDTAEMYPIPPKPETQGDTERCIGNWLQQSGRRDEVVIASKISPMGYLRDGDTKFIAKHISHAIDGSLDRLQTDYIDLYQLHWPERKTNFFGNRGYTNTMAGQDTSHLTDFLTTIQALDDEIKKGRIRAYGLSNETPWGTMRYICEAEKAGLTKPVTVQNPYSLLNRLYEVGMAEIAHREQVGLLAYSPLGFGVLSGKYLGNQQPEQARLTLFDNYQRYSNTQAKWATQQYAKIADEAGLSMAQMALAFINQQFFVTSNIIGATSLAQLKTNIDSINLALSDDVIDAINQVHEQQPNPSP